MRYALKISQIMLLLLISSTALAAGPIPLSSDKITICITESLKEHLSGKLAKRSLSLPDTQVYVIDEKLGSQIFEGVREDWLNYLNGDDFKQLLKKFANGNASKINKDQISQVIGVRLKGLSLVEAFKLFDEDHAFPSDLRRFVKQLGYLKDYLKNRKSLTSNELEQLSDQAKKVLKRLKKVPTEEDDIQIRPASAESNANFIHDTLDEVREISSEDVVKAPQYHRVRKDLRRVRVMFDLIAGLNNDPTAKFVSKYLDNLVDDMEVVHDKLIKKKLKGKIDYENQDVVFPDKLKQRLNDFLSMVR